MSEWSTQKDRKGIEYRKLGYDMAGRRLPRKPYHSDAPEVPEVIQEGNFLLVRSEYNEQFVKQIKARIPGPFRLWDKDRKVWKVSSGYKAVLEEVLEMCYGEYDGPPDMFTDTKQELVKLAREMPPKIKVAMYDAAARLPDKENTQEVPQVHGCKARLQGQNK